MIEQLIIDRTNNKCKEKINNKYDKQKLNRAFEIVSKLNLIKDKFNSYLESLISRGIVVPPAKTDANTHAPYSGFDSDKIAIPSPFLNSRSSIKYLAVFSANKLNPL